MNGKIWTFFAGLVLVGVCYGLAFISNSIPGDPFDYRQLVLLGNIVVTGLIGVLGFGIITGSRRDGDK